MAKRRKAAQGKKAPEEKRGFTVVTSAGKNVYLPVPGGVSEVEAHRLSDGLGIETKVVPIDQ